jgi:hypothetical protein
MQTLLPGRFTMRTEKPMTHIHFANLPQCHRSLVTLCASFTFILILQAGCATWAQAANGMEAPLRSVIEKFSNTKHLIMLRGVCDGGDIRASGKELGCSRCPDYTSSAGEKTGFLVTDILQGSFVRKHEQNALLNMEGCEPQSDLAGGMVLLTYTSNGWKRVSYLKGYRFEDCMKFPSSDGFRYLLCSQSSQAQGTSFGTLYWVSLENGDFSATPLLRWLDNVNSNPQHLLSIFPDRFFRSDFNQDGRGDIRIDVKIRNQEIPARYEGVIDAIESGFELADPEVIQIMYLFDGKSLVIGKEGKPGLERINGLVDGYESPPSP